MFWANRKLVDGILAYFQKRILMNISAATGYNFQREA